MMQASRVALVTGGGRSVGRGIALALGQAGFAVAVNDLHPDRADAVAAEIVAEGGRSLSIPFDCTDRDAARAGIAVVEGQLGDVDVLVYNAGVPEAAPRGPFLGSDPNTWSKQFDLNLFGPMHCIQAVVPGMVERGRGRVIQISSSAAAHGLSIGVSIYGAAKAGIEGLIRHLATEIGESGVTANVLALGLMENAAASGTDPMVLRLVEGVPVRRLGHAAEVGAAVRWLASDDAGFVTGQVIHLNGGALNGR